MQLRYLLLAFAIVATAFAVDVEEEDDVLVLTNDNFDAVLAENDLILVEFYAPWCGHCKNLAPHYAKAAATLKKADTPVALAKVDATAHRELGDKFGVRGFPTLKWFRGGNPSDYEGGRTESEIVAWVSKRSGPAAKTIATADEAETFATEPEVAVFGVFTDAESAEYKAFMTAAGGIDDVSFAVSTEAAVAGKYGVTAPAVVLLKKFDDKRADLTEGLTSAAISTFVNANKLPLVMEFTQEVAPKIFGGDIKIHHLVFVDKEAAGFDDVKAALTEAATEHKGRMLSIIVPKTEARVMSYFGFADSDLPAAVLVNMEGESGMMKYKLEGDVTAAALKAQAVEYFAGNLKPFLKTEEVPEEPMDGNVRVLVGKNFNEVALDETKDVLVEFYAPWCGHCKSLAPKYEQLGAEFKDIDSVIIAKVDATGNEVDVEGVSVKGFPTLYFFPAGKDAKPMLFNGARETEDMADYVMEHAGVSFTLDGEVGGPAGKDEL